MSLFKNQFKHLLEQDEEEIKPPQDVEGGESPMAGEIDPDTAPEDFGASVSAEEDIESIKQQSLASQKQELQTWISQIESFIDFLNGVNSDSVQAKLHNAGCDTMYEKIASSETKRIARVAVDLSALGESLKGYLIAGGQ
jgi:hypothetical protein